jgi:hypothetical protein
MEPERADYKENETSNPNARVPLPDLKLTHNGDNFTHWVQLTQNYMVADSELWAAVNSPPPGRDDYDFSAAEAKLPSERDNTEKKMLHHRSQDARAKNSLFKLLDPSLTKRFLSAKWASEVGKPLTKNFDKQEAPSSNAIWR